MEPELQALCAATATVTPWVSDDVNAQPTYDSTAPFVKGGPVTYAAHIAMKDSLIRFHDGREIMARGSVVLFVQGVVPVAGVPTTRDQVTLPAPFYPTHPPILDVRPAYDENGLHHVTLVIG